MENGLSGDAETTTNGASAVNGSWNPSTNRSGLNPTMTAPTPSYQTASTMVNGSYNGLDANALFVDLDGKAPEDQFRMLEDMLLKAQNLKRGAEGVLKPDLSVWPLNL